MQESMSKFIRYTVNMQSTFNFIRYECKIGKLLAYLLCFTFSIKAQSQKVLANKIDMKNIKRQTYLFPAIKVRCDSTNGTTGEERICANLELQEQDSLLNRELTIILKELKSSRNTILIKKILLSQDLWERYRYAHCNSCITDGGRNDMILFMKCATNLTIKRRDDIKSNCSY